MTRALSSRTMTSASRRHPESPSVHADWIWSLDWLMRPMRYVDHIDSFTIMDGNPRLSRGPLLRA